MIIDHIANASKYFSLHPLFESAFSFIHSNYFDQMPEGKTQVDEGLVAILSNANGKTKEDSLKKFECHNKNIDIQLCLSGNETIGWKPRHHCKNPNGDYNEEKDELALISYKAIIAEYPGSEEAKEALLAIKNIYVDAGTGDDYLSYLKTLPFASVSANAQDSISYQSANTRYLKADYENAINGFNSYLSKFEVGNPIKDEPAFKAGIFSTEAHANRAECYLKLAKEDLALSDFNYIIENNKTIYLERALLYAGRIEFKNKELPTEIKEGMVLV
jgi:YhcH/YjgK/YiaL family protein